MKKILIGILVLIVLAGGAWYLKNKAKKAVKKVEDKIEQKMEEGFTGSLKEAMMKKVPLKCEWQANGDSGESYVKGEDMYIATVMQGKKGYMIRKDGCMWTWDDETKEGVKICDVDTGETTVPEEEKNDSGAAVGMQAEGVDWNVDYKCSPAVFTDDKFTLPTDVVFKDMNEMMKGIMGGMEKVVPVEE